MKSTGRDRDPAFGRLIARGLAREVDTSGNACPDADLLAAWFDHTLSSPEGERIEAHAAGCECCQQVLAALARSEPEVIRAAPLPAPARAWHWHWRWVVPLATAVLVVVVGTRTLRAPGPLTVVGTPSQEAKVATTARLRPSGSGGASPQPVQVAPSPQPAQVAMNQVASAPAPGADARSRTARVGEILPAPPPPLPPPSGLRPPVFGAAAPAAAAAPQAMKPENQMAELARRQADVASDKMLRSEALKTAASQPAVPTVAESVSVEGRAAGRATGLQGLRPVSVAAPAVPGSAIAWRFGQDGAIDKSSDRGQTWERQSSGVTTALVDASAPNDRVCWMVGARGVVLRTIDGLTWRRLTSPTDADLVAVHAWNELSATVTASDRSEYETTDGGKSWRRRQR